jgi:hypothetical protein
MAEFIGQEAPEVLSGFSAMGQPVPSHRRQEALNHCRSMGLDTERSWSCVQQMSEQLARDEPYRAMEAGMRFLDLVGTYRLMAVLLTAEGK